MCLMDFIKFADRENKCVPQAIRYYSLLLLLILASDPSPQVNTSLKVASGH